MQDSTNIKKYRRLAPVYDAVFGAVFRRARSRAITKLRFKDGDRVLLVGVGTGEDLHLIPGTCVITGIDISEEMLAIARKKAGENTTLLNMNAEKTSFSDKSFDHIILSLILSVAENPRAVVLECLRLMKDQGTMLIFDKFRKEGKKVTFLRKIINVVSSAIGTDINRSLKEILSGLPVRELQNEASMLHGNYRIVLLIKD